MEKITLKQEEINLIRKFSELYFKLRNLSYELYNEYNYRNSIEYIENFNIKNNIPEYFKDIGKFIFAQISNSDLYVKIGCYVGESIDYPLEFITDSKGYELFHIITINERLKVLKKRELILKVALDENAHECKRESISRYTLKRNMSIEKIEELILLDSSNKDLKVILPKNENTKNKLVSLISNALDIQEKIVDEFVNFMQSKKDKELENLLK